MVRSNNIFENMKLNQDVRRKILFEQTLRNALSIDFKII